MTIAPCGALVKAAHEPSPAKGLSGILSTFTGTSERAQAIRTTPSGVVVALAPEAAAIASGSRCVRFWASASGPERQRPKTADTAMRKALELRFMVVVLFS